jgi:KDEL-tailed cysteine endopeptidase
MDAAFWYVMDHGITTEDMYKYTAKTGKCTYDEKKMKFYSINQCEEVTANSTDALRSAVAKQPVSISVEADTLVFQFYSKGIIGNPKCGQDLDHGILLTGYGSDENGNLYWECKNSWGPSWGMKGYLRIQRDDSVKGGICGILMENSVPLNE